MARNILLEGFAVPVVALIAGFSIPALGEDIKLPPPNEDSRVSVVQALKLRQSQRQFSDREIPLDVLSGVLWAANGFNRPDKRTNATGMNKQTIVVYAIMKSGAYRYDAKDNALVKVCGDDLRSAIAAQQSFAAKAPVSILITADLSDPVYKAPWDTLTHYDAGIVSGNIYLYCAANGLATVCRGSMDRDALKKALNLPASTVLHLNHPIGWPTSATMTDAAKNAIRTAVRARRARDLAEYGHDGVRDVERLYRAYSRKGESAADELETLVAKYPKANRTGCAVMYAAQRSQGEERISWLKKAIENHGDCFYGDGAQVGAYARWYFAKELAQKGDKQAAEKLLDEIRKDFPNAVTHRGQKFADLIKD